MKLFVKPLLFKIQLSPLSVERNIPLKVPAKMSPLKFTTNDLIFNCDNPLII